MTHLDWQAIWLTLRLAGITSVVLLLLGMPIAIWLSRSRSRWRPLVEAIVAMPLILPPTVLGFYLLVVLGPASPIGRGVEHVTGSLLPFTFPGLVVGSVLFSMPFAVQPFTAGFRSVDPRLEEVSWCHGVSRWKTFVRVTLPMARPGILAGFVLSFAHTLGEFGVALMIGGNIAGVTRTVSISIYDAVQAMDYQRAGWTSGFLLLSAFILLGTLNLIQGPRISLWRRTG